MIIFLDTSSPVCRLSLKDNGLTYEYEWASDRNLAKGLLSYIQDQLKKHNKSWSDIDYIGVKSGPGSFTGLRIGLTVMNTLADTNKVPIISGRGDDWIEEADKKISNNIDEKIIIPFYDSEPNITTPKK